MKSIDLGAVKVDAVDYAISRNAVLGITDSGKTYTATYIAERLFDAGIPFIVFDPIGVWRFMRVPGKGPGRPVVVAGGLEGDLPLTVANAPKIVEAAMQNGVSLVIDLFSYELTKADWRRIVCQCVKLLLHRNSGYGLRHVFLEEAAEFVPQANIRDGDVYAECEKLARMGGNAKLGVTFINQRAQEVNKAVLELCNSLLLHRQRGKNAIQSLEKWMEAGVVGDTKALVASLANLPTGELWAWLGNSDRAVRCKVPQKDSYHPDRRAMQGTVKPAAKAVDVSTFVGTLKEALPAIEAEAKATDPKELRKRIVELEREVVKLTATPKVERVEVPVLETFDKQQLAIIREEINSADNNLAALQITLSGTQRTLDELVGKIDATLKRFPLAGVGKLQPVPAGRTAVGEIVHAPTARAPKQGGHDVLSRSGDRSSVNGSSGLRRMMIALAQRPGLTKRQLGLRAGLSSSSGTFGTYLGKLRGNGWVDEANGGLRLSNAGQVALGDYVPLPEGRALQQYWLAELGGGAARMLEVLCDVFPQGYSADQLGNKAGLSASSGTFGTYLGKLRTLELVMGDRSCLRASDELFD